MDQFFCHSKIVEIQKTFKIENIFKSENFLIRKNHKQNYNPNSSKPQLNKSNIENQHPGFPNLSKMKYNKADSKIFNFQDARVQSTSMDEHRLPSSHAYSGTLPNWPMPFLPLTLLSSCRFQDRIGNRNPLQ